MAAAEKGQQTAVRLINDLQDISFTKIGMILLGTGLVILLARKLQSLIDQDGQRAREAMEMSQEHAPELSLISQEQPPTRWGTSLTNSESMHSLLSRLDWTKPGKVQSLNQPSDLQSLLEHLP